MLLKSGVGLELFEAFEMFSIGGGSTEVMFVTLQHENFAVAALITLILGSVFKSENCLVFTFLPQSVWLHHKFKAWLLSPRVITKLCCDI